MGYACFTEDGNQAAIIVTNLENGDTLGVCPDHLIDYALGLLQSVSELQWMPVIDKATGPGADDPTDEDEPAEGPTVPAPASRPLPGVEDVELPDEDQADEEGGQLAEDHAVRDADLRDEIDVLSRGF